MISVQEARQKLQAVERKPAGWYAETFLRPFAFIFIWVFLNLGVSANTATLLHVLCGLLGLAFLVSGVPHVEFLSLIIFQIWFLLDLVDGDLSRILKQSSVSGIYFDLVSHYLIFPLFFIGFGWISYQASAQAMDLWLVVAVVFNFFMRKAVDDLQLAATLIQFRRDIALKLPVQLFASSSENKSQPSIALNSKRSPLFFLHVLCSFPAVMNVFTIAFLLERLFSPSFFILRYVLIFYALTYFLFWFRVCVKAIRNRTADKIYKDLKSNLGHR